MVFFIVLHIGNTLYTTSIMGFIILLSGNTLHEVDLSSGFVISYQFVGLTGIKSIFK